MQILQTDHEGSRLVFGVEFPFEEAASLGYRNDTEACVAYDSLDGKDERLVRIYFPIPLAPPTIGRERRSSSHTFSYSRDVYPSKIPHHECRKFLAEYELDDVSELSETSDDRIAGIAGSLLAKPIFGETLKARLLRYDITFYWGCSPYSREMTVTETSKTVIVLTPDAIHNEFRGYHPENETAARSKPFRVSDLTFDRAFELFMKFVERLKD